MLKLKLTQNENDPSASLKPYFNQSEINFIKRQRRKINSQRNSNCTTKSGLEHESSLYSETPMFQPTLKQNIKLSKFHKNW